MCEHTHATLTHTPHTSHMHVHTLTHTYHACAHTRHIHTYTHAYTTHIWMYVEDITNTFDYLSSILCMQSPLGSHE